jgi:GT2 family glycosyltransferase
MPEHALPRESNLRTLYSSHRGKVSDKWSIYLDTYSTVLEKYRELPISLLEIGVQNGGSLEIWSQYFKRAKHLVGCDINTVCGQLHYVQEAISIVIGNADDDATEIAIRRVTPDFDLIIDDGSHASEDIVRSFCRYFGALRPGGTYIAEDLHCSYWQEYQGGLYFPYSSIAFFKALVDVINQENWGLDKERQAVLEPFFTHYGCSLDDHALAQIHSIAFVNSMCIVRKESNAANELGPRIISGTQCAVVPQVGGLSGTLQRAPAQQSSPWEHPPEQAAQDVIVKLRQQIDDLTKELAQLRPLGSPGANADAVSHAKSAAALSSSAATPLPWLPVGRWLPAEKIWSEAALSLWAGKPNGLTSIALALLPHTTLPVQPTTDSLNVQWLSGQLLQIAPQPDSEQLISMGNRELRSAEAQWLGLIDAGDQLAPDALFRIAHAVREHPQWQIVYTDEDQITADGQHTNPHCKPDFNLDYLRSLPYVGGLLLIRRDLFEALGGFDPQAEGAEDYDLMLRAWEHLQRTGAGEAAIGHVPEVLYHRLQGSGHTQKSVPEILQAGHSALQRHFERLGIAAQVQPGPFPPSFRVRWPLPEARPLVSILVPTRDQLPLLQRCVESVIEKTKYPAYEILIIDNDSQTIDARNYLAAIEAKEAELGGRLRVVRQPGPFNFSAMNNAAARAARGEYLLLLNNDTAALHDDWLDEMMGHAVRPDVGIVGAKLLYPDGKIQHAGVILGLRGPAEHPFIGRPPEDRGYFGRAQLTQDLSAVTGACLLVRKSVYEQVGGLDEQAFKVSYNDIDLCLKVREAGLRIVFTPYALLMHEGSASQKSGTETQPDNAKLKRFAAEKDAMYAKWLPQLAFDPAYNRHLSLASTDFLLDDQPCLSWDPDWRPRPRVLVHSADREGCGEYRIIAPMRALNRAGLTQGWETMRLFEPAEMERMQPDSLVVQRQMEWPQIEALERHARTSKAFRVFEIDDLITNLPHKSVHKSTIHKDIAKRFRKAAGLCNRLVVATEPLAKAYAHFTDEVVVQPNYLEAARWGHLQPARAERSKPRVGWAGGVGHTGDLELIADLVRDTASEVDWVFFGLCPEALKPLVKEFHPGVPLDQYAAKLAALDLDLAVAPLEDNAFNEAKSHLRLLEYGILGYPVICSDLTPYQGDFPVTRVANRYRDWTRALREAVSDRAALRAQGDALRAKVLADWMMEDHLDTWLKAWLR